MSPTRLGYKMQLHPYNDYKETNNMALIRKVRGFTPKTGKNCFLAETAVLIGDVTIGDECSIWYNTVLRGDVNTITIGNRVNIQDGSVLHTLYRNRRRRIDRTQCYHTRRQDLRRCTCRHGCRRSRSRRRRRRGHRGCRLGCSEQNSHRCR